MLYYRMDLDRVVRVEKKDDDWMAVLTCEEEVGILMGLILPTENVFLYACDMPMACLRTCERPCCEVVKDVDVSEETE